MYGLDLFSGIGGITKALEGYVVPVAYCENNRYAQAVLLSRMSEGSLPTAPIWDDVRTLKRVQLQKPIDIIYGGFPCQDISIVGCGVGLAGKRSSLFFEVIRLVSEIRPQFVFLENVPKIIDRGLVAVAREFAVMRYDCRWGILSSRGLGANHNRRRWWLLAHANGKRRHGLDENKKNRCANLYRFVPQKGQDKSPDLHIPVVIPITEAMPGILRVDDGISEELDRIGALGNSVDPRVAREAFERLMGVKK